MPILASYIPVLLPTTVIRGMLRIPLILLLILLALDKPAPDALAPADAHAVASQQLLEVRVRERGEVVASRLCVRVRRRRRRGGWCNLLAI